MVPSPRKPPGGSPRKVLKATRTSPRKKAWATPPKVDAVSLSDFLASEDVNKMSWAEITETDEELNALLAADRKGSSASDSSVDSRRKGLPQKTDQNGKVKYVHSRKLTSLVFESTSSQKNATKVVRETKRETTRIRKEKVVVETEKVQIVEKTSRKRLLSNASSVNGGEGSPTKRRVDTGKSNRKAARARVVESSASSTASSPGKNRDHWEEPTLGWCKDEAVLARRSREIARAKEKAVYIRYIDEVPLRDRIKGQHPRTPNKLINFSRRSWDTQIKKWKRSLYDYYGEEPSESVNTSFCSFSDSDMSEKDEERGKGKRSVLQDIDIPVRADVDCMASLLGRFDVDSQMAIDESTLKASTNSDPSAPTDFSHMMQQNQ